MKRRVVYRFDVEPEGRLSGKRPFVEIEAHAGCPDGSVADSEGCIWIALYGGWAVRRYSPQGQLLETVSLPCANVTKLAFGGSSLQTAFVTTARKGLSQGELAAQPLAGGLFAFEVDVPGLQLGTMATR
jgi:sugar lactone lactonase YvrE